MENILFKISFPAEFHAQTAAEAAVLLHPRVKDRLHEIDRIVITTHESAIRIISKVGPLANPADRDHCLQYMTAVPLIFGTLTAEHYEDTFHAAHPIIDELRAKMDEITAKEANEALGLEGDKYEYNLDAKIFYKVKAKVVYLAESDANVEPIDITRFHRTDRYDYILELDGERNIIGGEWIGNSRTSHPDFLWSPYQVQRSPVPFLDIKEVRELIRLSRLVDPAARGMQDPEFVYPEPPAPVEEPVEEPVTESPEPGTDTDTDTDTPAPEPTDVD